MHFRAALALTAATFLPSTAWAQSAAQPAYGITLGRDGAARITRGRQTAEYRPIFTIIRSDSDPQLGLSAFSSTPGEHIGNVSPENYPLPQWRSNSGGGRTDIVFDAGSPTTVTATGSRTLPDGSIAWSFAEHPDFTLSATLQDVPGKAPRLHWSFTARREGWYSVGYTGGPASDPAGDSGFLQPLIWQEKRFPRAPLTSAESMGGLPLTLVSRNGVTNGLSVDPAESPFRLPTIANARFGVMLRSRDGKAQPSAFAPLFGQADSHLNAGQTVAFSVRPLLTTGDWYAGFTEAARDLFNFSDNRANVDQSLNATIDQMTEFAMDDRKAGWDADLKGFDYNTDVKGTVKVVSALHPLSLALIQDNPEIYRRRALPITEFLMSRTKYLYNALPDEAGQNAARDMKGPSAEVSELAELYQISRGQSPVFRHYATSLAGKPRQLNLLMVSDGATFWDKLALYRLTRDPSRLSEARSLADRYVKARINTPQTNFDDVHLGAGGQFWSDFAPRFVELFELWQETKEPRYLAAAQAGARSYASYAWYFPMIPPGNATVDKGSVAPVGLFTSHPGATPIPTPEVSLPAWQVSQIGLTPEAQTTYALNPGVFLAHQAAYELRIAGATGDTFLHDAARAAIVGRYKTFPGYDINVAFSNVYARADYQDRPYNELNYNEIYYNHVWPHLALLTDYLMSDFEMRSKGAIAFPARYAQGYAYLRSKVYGDRPGKFMGDDNVRLWMPRGLVKMDDPQANYVTGYGNKRFYLALTNETPIPRTVRVTFDRARVPYELDRPYAAELWQDGKAVGNATRLNGSITVPLTSRGLSAVVIEDLPVFTRLQNGYFSDEQPKIGERSYRQDQTDLGTATGMFLGLGTRNDFYLWTSASDNDVREVRATIKGAGPDKTIVDARHPFEFSVPANGAKRVSYSLQFVRNDGSVLEVPERSVER